MGTCLINAYGTFRCRRTASVEFRYELGRSFDSVPILDVDNGVSPPTISCEKYWSTRGNFSQNLTVVA